MSSTLHRARPFDTTKVCDLRRVTTRDVARSSSKPPRCPGQATSGWRQVCAHHFPE